MRTLTLLSLALLGCTQTLDPCPSGTRIDRGRDRCVMVGPRDAEVVLELDAVVASEPDSGDADGGADEIDAGPDADMSDADGEDSDGKDSEASDAELDAADAGEQVDTGVAPVCSEADLQAWTAGHLQPGLVALISSCYTSCKADAACADHCVHDQIGLQGCETCTSEQASCSSTFCGAACTVSQSDKMCLACLCEADCVGIFDRCAHTQIGVCTPALFGRDAAPGELTLSAPILLRQKSETGGMRAVRLAVEEGQVWPTISTYQFSTGFDTLLSFPLAAREYVLHAKSTCGLQPCIARISPVLNDGSFGHPLYDQAWPPGFDEVDFVTVGASPYLLRYKSGRTPSDGEPTGTLWIDRLDVDTQQIKLSLAQAARTSWLTSTQHGFTSVNTFQLGVVSYVLLHAGDSGDVQLQRIEAPDAVPTLQLTAIASNVSWPDVDVVETLKLDGSWYVFTYDNAAGTSKQGTARIFGFVSGSDGQVSLSEALYEASWPERISHAMGYTWQGVTHLMTLDASSGIANQRTVGSSIADWAGSLQTVVQTQSVGTRPPWNVLEVARQGKW